MPPAIVLSLAIHETAERPLAERIVGVIGDHRLWLGPDNLEHLTDAAPLLVPPLTGCPWLSIFATSSAPLHLGGETGYARSAIDAARSS